MYFLIEDDGLFEKFDSEPVDNKNDLKAKLNLMVMKLQTFMIKKILS